MLHGGGNEMVLHGATWWWCMMLHGDPSVCCLSKQLVTQSDLTIFEMIYCIPK